MSLEVARALIHDDRAEVRLFGLRLLGGDGGQEETDLLVLGSLDRDEAVSREALALLRERHPWLLLQPFPPRPLPDEAKATPLGRAWTRLGSAFRAVLAAGPEGADLATLRRWAELPGAVPEIVSALEEAGRAADARLLAAGAGLYDVGSTICPQVMLAPTYRCNIACSYCYVREWSRAFPAHMSREDMITALDWCARQGVEVVLLSGGEPTVYEGFAGLLRAARERGLRAHLTSNCLYSDGVKRSVDGDHVELLVGHYDQEITTASPERRRGFEEAMRAARAAGTKLMIRYTLTGESSRAEWTPILDLSQALEIPHVNYAFAFRSILGNNTFVAFGTPEERARFEETFLTFYDDCRARGLGLHLCKPVPLCALSEPTRRRFLLDGTLRSACAAYLDRYVRNLTINPDLTTFPCNAICVSGPSITELADRYGARPHFEPLITKLLHHPLMDDCRTCMLAYTGLCQGVCLAQKHEVISVQHMRRDG